MSLSEFEAARQYLVEEHIGQALRRQQAAEDAKVEATRRYLAERGKRERPHGAG